MISIEIDGKIYQVKEGDNLLQACLSLGLDLPYFCWHPAMGSVGACRQCAVTQYQDRHDDDDSTERDEQGRIVMGCMTPVTEGMRISIKADSAREFRSDIIELLMTNHPHDCPVCEEGGECHLQDMTVMTGHTAREYTGTKRTHRNQYLGPFITHEMNRCIACYRCVRYYQDYAGGHDLQAMASHNHVYFGRHENGVLENEFSGNLVEVCPTGVFTDKTLSERYSRKWDLQTAPSICVHCAQGCNTSPGERYGETRRIVNRYNGEVNGYFLCDRGRFGYGFVNREDRVHRAAKLVEGEAVDLDRNETREALVEAIGPGKKLLGIGSPRASLEANFALRELVGAENFYSGADDQQTRLAASVLDILKQASVNIPTLNEVEEADAVLVLGEDVINTSPRLALSLRQAARNAGLIVSDEVGVPRWQDAAVREAAQRTRSPLYIASILPTRIDDIAKQTLNATPDDIAALGFAIAHAIDESAPQPGNLSEAQTELAHAIAEDLKQAEKPLIVSGTGCCNEAVIQAAVNIATALSKVRSNGKQVATNLFYCLPECNSMGLALMQEEQGQSRLRSIAQAISQLQGGTVDTVIVLENDLTRRLENTQCNNLFANAQQVISIDHRLHECAQRDGLVLPAATFDECEGTLVSSEGRAQRYFSVHLPKDDVRASWEWLSDMIALHRGEEEPPWEHLDEVTKQCAAEFASLSDITQAAPDEDFRIRGMKIARQTHRASGRTAMLANIKVSEPKQPEDPDSALGYTMEGFPGEKPTSATPYYWSPGWNSNQSVGKFQAEVNGPLKGGDPGIRLLDNTAAEIQNSYFSCSTQESGGGFLILPTYQIFGSEELSALAAPVSERAPDPYVVLAKEDADELGVEQGDGVILDQLEQSLEVLVDENAPKGAVCVSAGFPQTAGLVFHQRSNIEIDTNWQRRVEPDVIATSADSEEVS